MRRRAGLGFTAMEAVAALAIAGLAIVVASGVALRRHAVARRIDERVAALRIVSSRIDDVLAGPRPAPGTRAFVPEPTTPPLTSAAGTVAVDAFEPGLLRVRVELRWSPSGRIVRETIMETSP